MKSFAWSLVLVFCLLSLLQSSVAQASPLLLDSTKGSYLLGKHTQVYIDPSRQADLQQALQAFERGEFKAVDQDVPNYGFTGHAYWFRFELQTVDETQDHWYVAVEYPLIDHISLYYEKMPGSQDWQRMDSGDWLPFKARDLKNRNFYYEVPVAHKSPRVFYLRMQTEGSSEFKMGIKNMHQIAAEDHELQFYQGAFVGLMAIMIAYYFVLTIGARSLEYLAMTLFLSSALFFKMVMNGLAFEYLWPQAIWWGNKASSLSVPFIFFCAGLNAYTFLPLKQYPRFRMAYLALTGVLGLQCLLSFVLPYSMIKLYILTGLLMMALIYLSSTYIYRQGYRPALFFLLAWISLILGAGIYGSQKLGILPVSVFTTNVIELACAALVVLLSLGSSDKINEMNKAKREAERQARLLTEEMNSRLEAQVNERTAQLWQQTKGMEVMLHNIQQGICTINGEGVLYDQYSPYLEQLLGEKNLQNKSLFELFFARSNLSGEQLSLVASVVGASVGEESFNFETNSHLLPHKLSIESAEGLRAIEVEWAAIDDKENRVQRVLVAIRDVTEVRKAEEMAAARAKELEVMGVILEMPASKFKHYVASARHLLQECHEILAGEDPGRSWSVILRNIHTIKGNSRTYDLDDMSHLIHEVENVVFSFVADRLDSSQKEQTRICLQKISTQITAYEILHDEKLKRGSFAELEESILRLTAIVNESWDQLPRAVQRDLDGIITKLDKMNINSFTKAIKPIVHSLKPIADQLHKKSPRVEVEGEDFYLNESQIELVEDIFVHLFRNSLDHGFDKENTGCITIRLLHRTEASELVYSDDGKGLNIELLRKRGVERGILPEGATDVEVAQSIFITGVSSAEVVTEISGRGVGMDAVREFAKQLGGSVRIELEGPGQLAGFQLFSLRFQLPPQKLVQNTHAFAEAS